MIVVDANVVMALVTEDSLTHVARAIHAKDPNWTVPPLWRYEVLNALLNQAKVDKFGLDDTLLAAETAACLLTDRADGCESSSILTTAHSSGLTAYDATYVVLARSLGVPLVTEDKQILRACPDVARSMKQFLSPPEAPMAVKEKPAIYKTRRAGKRGGA